MGIFSTNKEGNSKENINWIQLNSVLQLENIKLFSNEKPVLIFKHSTRCSVSRMALRQFEREFKLSDSIETYFLDLLEFRDLSNQIATNYNTAHQSPQVLLIQNGTCTYSATHSDIDPTILEEKI